MAFKDGRPVEVPRLVCETREDKLRFLHGRLRRELRSVQKADFERLEASFAELKDSELEALMSAESVII